MQLLCTPADIWTGQEVEYRSYMDTATPTEYHMKGGVWTMGSAYIANARESLYWLATLKEYYTWHRTFKFLIENG